MDDALAAAEADARRIPIGNGIPLATKQTDWFVWRRKWPIWIAKSDEDGSLENWQELLRSEGATRLDGIMVRLKAELRKGGRIRFGDVLEAIAALQSHNPAEDEAQRGEEESRAYEDRLIWDICHSGKCYADSIGGPWQDVGDGIKVDPLTPERRAGLERRAEDARRELLRQTGCVDHTRWKPRLYEMVRNSKKLVEWLRIQRLIPQKGSP